jgi:hypothetical protein
MARGKKSGASDASEQQAESDETPSEGHPAGFSIVDGFHGDADAVHGDPDAQHTKG